MKIKYSQGELQLMEELLVCLKRANALDGSHASNTFEAIGNALVRALEVTIANGRPVMWGSKTKSVAWRVYDECLNNYESVEYNIRLWNEGIISL